MTGVSPGYSGNRVNENGSSNHSRNEDGSIPSRLVQEVRRVDNGLNGGRGNWK